LTYARAAAVLVQTVLLLLAAEFAARVIEAVRPARDELSFTYAPYRMLRMAKAPWPLNRDGFRALDWDAYRGKFLIEFLGGSVCLGVGTNPGKTVPERLEAELRHRGLARAAVVNLCQGGATSAQELAIFLQYGVPLQPGVVLSFDGANDFMHPRPVGDDPAPNLPYRNAEMQARFDGQHSWPDHLAVVRTMWRYLRNRGASAFVHSAVDQPTVQDKDIIESYEYVIGITALLARHAGAYYAVLFQPTLHYRKPWSDAEAVSWRNRVPQNGERVSALARRLYEGATPKIVDWARSNDITFLDLTGAFEAVPDTIYSDSVHFTGERGYTTLFQAIEREGLIDRIAALYGEWERRRPSYPKSPVAVLR
jgi:hypothetical protein